MLALFKETHTEMAPSLLPWARMLWRKALDKGIILTSSDLTAQWNKEFPDSSCLGLAEWVETLKPDWLLNNKARDIREIFCHGPHLIEAIGSETQVITAPLMAEDWELWIETIAAMCKLEFNFTSPCASAQFQYENTQWRVTVLHGSVSPQGQAKVFLRQLAVEAYNLERFGLESSSEALLKGLMKERANILLAGATGSGKTSLLSSLLVEVDPRDHLILLEDTQEISCHLPRVTRLLASRLPGRSLSDYLAHSLRLSPDRIILGEMRSHEVIPYLLAMNTGHQGLLSTIHAASAMDALLRVAQLFVLASGQKDINYQEVLRLVTRNVGYVVFLEKRKITQLIKVYGCDGDLPLYDNVLNPS